mgnify:CR=1 FL=1
MIRKRAAETSAAANKHLSLARSDLETVQRASELPVHVHHLSQQLDLDGQKGAEQKGVVAVHIVALDDVEGGPAAARERGRVREEPAQRRQQMAYTY